MNKPGYQKWKETGRRLFQSGINADLYEMLPTQLYERKLKGEEWLRENPNHKQYLSQLKRYELICERLEELTNEPQ